MKLIGLFFGCALCLSASAFAINQHSHPQVKNIDIQSVNASVACADDCEIEIINQSYNDVRVFGVFDDGSELDPFNIYSFEAPHYISLYYDGYCHRGMDLDIDTFRGYHMFGNYVRGGETILIASDWLNQVKATVQK